MLDGTIELLGLLADLAVVIPMDCNTRAFWSLEVHPGLVVMSEDLVLMWAYMFT